MRRRWPRRRRRIRAIVRRCWSQRREGRTGPSGYISGRGEQGGVPAGSSPDQVPSGSRPWAIRRRVRGSAYQVTNRRNTLASPARPLRRRDPVIRGVEQELNLLPRQRPHRRPGLDLGDVHHRVPLVTHLHRMRSEPLPAHRTPAVTGVGDVVTELPHRRLDPRSVDNVSPPSRRCADHASTSSGAQRHGYSPLNSNQPLTRRDRARRQPTRASLRRPRTQHPLHDGVLRVQVHHRRRHQLPRKKLIPALAHHAS